MDYVILCRHSKNAKFIGLTVGENLDSISKPKRKKHTMSNIESKINGSTSKNKILWPSIREIDESGKTKYQKAKNAIKEHNNCKEQSSKSMK